MEIELPDFIISDTHFGHPRISEYSRRTTPAFPTPESIDQLMIDNWFGLVKPHHTVLHLGDLGFFNDGARGRGMDPEILKSLPGKRYILRGNHDDALSTEWLADHGFTEIPSPSVVYEGVEILFTHYPQHPLRKGQACISGHVHNNPHFSTSQHLNASVELWHYAPVPGEFLAKKLVWSSNTNAGAPGPRTVLRRTGKRHR